METAIRHVKNVVYDTFNRNKLAVALFAVNLAVLLIAYNVYLINGHYSDDTFTALSPHNLAEVNLGNGRFIHFLFYSALDAIGFDLPSHMRITQLILTLVCAFGTSMVSRRFSACLRTVNPWQMVLLDAAVLLTIVNPYFLSGWYYWPETCAGASIGVLCTFFSIIIWCVPNKTWKRKGACLLLLVLATSMYQVYLEFFIGLAIAYTLLEHSFRANRRLIIDLLTVIVWCVIAVVVNYCFVLLIGTVGGVSMPNFSLGESVGLAERVNNILLLQYEVAVELNGMLPFGFLLVVVLFFIVASAVYVVRNGRLPRIRDVLVLLACLVGIYAACYAPEFASQYWPVPRLFVGLFTLPTLAVSLFAYEVQNSDVGQRVGAVFICMALVTSAVNMIALQSDTLRCNEFDDAQLTVICETMNAYEEETGERVTEIRFCNDKSPWITIPGIHRIYDMNMRCLSIQRHFTWAMRDRLGAERSYVEVVEIDDAQRTAVFGDANWDWFIPSEQIVFDGPIMYVAFY